jgi:hypothetical protein
MCDEYVLQLPCIIGHHECGECGSESECITIAVAGCSFENQELRVHEVRGAALVYLAPFARALLASACLTAMPLRCSTSECHFRLLTLVCLNASRCACDAASCSDDNQWAAFGDVRSRAKHSHGSGGETAPPSVCHSSGSPPPTISRYWRGGREESQSEA